MLLILLVMGAEKLTSTCTGVEMFPQDLRSW